MKHDRFAGRKKPELPGQDPEWLITLKKWVDWKIRNPDKFLEEEKDLAQAVNNLFSLLGTERAKHEKRVKQLEGALEKIIGPYELPFPQSKEDAKPLAMAAKRREYDVAVAREALGGGEEKK